MAGHVYHELFVHLVWHTKQSEPMLAGELEPQVHDYLRRRCQMAKGLYIHAIDGTPTHVHLALNYEPWWAVSEIVKDLKGACSHDINAIAGQKVLEWQRGFGAVSFGKGNLGVVRKYIVSQKQHHAKGMLHERLERIAFDEENDGKELGQRTADTDAAGDSV